MKDLTDTRQVAACRQTTIANRQSAIPLKSAIGNRQSPILGLLCALASVALGVSALAQSPTLIPYQGRLTNPQGVPYTNGQYTLAFTLYDQPVGGTVVWGPETHYKVGVINGMVNAFLGSITPLTNVDFSQTRHLGITIYADNNPNNPAPEMVPRQMIIPAFWAKHSEITENSEKLAGYDWTPIFGVNNPNGPLSGTKLQTNSITAAQIASNTITADQIAPQSITAGQIANATITSNQMAAPSVGTLQLADGAVTLPKLAPRQVGTNVGPGGVAISLDTGLTSYVPGNIEYSYDVTNLTVTITTTGRPVFVSLVACTNMYALFNIPSIELFADTNNSAKCVLVLLRGSQIIDWTQIGFNGGLSYNSIYSCSPSFYHALDTPPPGTWTYKLQYALWNGSRVLFNGVRLVAYEL